MSETCEFEGELFFAVFTNEECFTYPPPTIECQKPGFVACQQVVELRSFFLTSAQGHVL